MNIKAINVITIKPTIEETKPGVDNNSLPFVKIPSKTNKKTNIRIIAPCKSINQVANFTTSGDSGLIVIDFIINNYSSNYPKKEKRCQFKPQLRPGGRGGGGEGL